MLLSTIKKNKRLLEAKKNKHKFSGQLNEAAGLTYRELSPEAKEVAFRNYAEDMDRNFWNTVSETIIPKYVQELDIFTNSVDKISEDDIDIEPTDIFFNRVDCEISRNNWSLPNSQFSKMKTELKDIIDGLSLTEEDKKILLDTATNDETLREIKFNFTHHRLFGLLFSYSDYSDYLDIVMDDFISELGKLYNDNQSEYDDAIAEFNDKFLDLVENVFCTPLSKTYIEIMDNLGRDISAFYNDTLSEETFRSLATEKNMLFDEKGNRIN